MGPGAGPKTTASIHHNNVTPWAGNEPQQEEQSLGWQRAPP